MSCPDENEVAALVQGFLDDEQTRQIQAHADRCVACLQLLVDLAGLVAPVEAAGLPKIGRYEILEELGSGAQGVVYAAFDPELQRRVAIKIVRPDRPPAKARLQREARLLASLSHPNVVPVFEVGPYRDGVFMVTELVTGGTLREWLQSPRSRAEVLAVFRGVASGLLAAHRAGLVHRDVKPENILIHEDGRGVLTDFGMASDHASSEHPGGTPLYMAPELFRGEPADERSDQFAFAATLYEALHGAPPFSGETLPQLRDAARTGRFTLGNQQVPGRLDTAIRRGLHATPSARYADMGTLWLAVDGATRAPTRWIAAAAIAVTIGIFGIWSMAPEPVQPAPVFEVPAPPAATPEDVLRDQIHAFWTATGCDELVSISKPLLSASDRDFPTHQKAAASAKIASCFEDLGDCDRVQQWYARAKQEEPHTVWRILSPPCPPADVEGRVGHLFMHLHPTDKEACLSGGERIRALYTEPSLSDEQRTSLRAMQLSMILQLLAKHLLDDEAEARAETARANQIFDVKIDVDALIASQARE